LFIGIGSDVSTRKFQGVEQELSLGLIEHVQTNRTSIGLRVLIDVDNNRTSCPMRQAFPLAYCSGALYMNFSGCAFPNPPKSDLELLDGSLSRIFISLKNEG
jgi:hypothetical protein